MTKVPMTALGAEKLRAELERLKNQERPRIINAISEARAHGDLKENAEYHAAKEQQSFTEGRIREIESKLSHAEIIDVTKMSPGGRVVFGATVKLLNVASETEVTYQIVGEDEADIKYLKISVTSPIARAMIGKSVDEEIIVKTPQGDVSYEIISVEYC
jgi:transcription elongation factor GreA